MLLGERNRPGRPFSHSANAAIHPSGEIFFTGCYGSSQVHRCATDSGHPHS
jgi:hypothetical protein